MDYANVLVRSQICEECGQEGFLPLIGALQIIVGLTERKSIKISDINNANTDNFNRVILRKIEIPGGVVNDGSRFTTLNRFAQDFELSLKLTGHCTQNI